MVILIVGCTNSGNTLMQNLLALHPKVATLRREGHIYLDQIGLHSPGYLRVLKKTRCWADDKRILMTEIDPPEKAFKGIELWRRKALYPERPVLVVKSPPDIMRVRWWNRYVKDIFFVLMIRNGLAVAEGISRKCQLHGGRVSLQKAATQWFLCAKEVSNLLGSLPTKSAFIRYEDLCRDPNKVVSSIFRKIGLSAIVIDKNKNLTVQRNTGPIKNRNNVSLSNLSERQIDLIKSIQLTMLERFGYD